MLGGAGAWFTFCRALEWKRSFLLWCSQYFSIKLAKIRTFVGSCLLEGSVGFEMPQELGLRALRASARVWSQGFIASEVRNLGVGTGFSLSVWILMRMFSKRVPKRELQPVWHTKLAPT